MHFSLSFYVIAQLESIDKQRAEHQHSLLRRRALQHLRVDREPFALDKLRQRSQLIRPDSKRHDECVEQLHVLLNEASRRKADCRAG
jgi:hypothetical protein